MNKFNHFIGIDISKKTFDAALIINGKVSDIKHQDFAQNETGFAHFLDWLMYYKVPLNEVLICMEHTGLYTYRLIDLLMSEQMFLWVEMPLRIKKCMGLQRGGDDKAAAIQIALYAYRYQDAVSLWNPEQSIILQLRQLSAQRDRLKSCFNQLTIPLKEIDNNLMSKIGLLFLCTVDIVVRGVGIGFPEWADKIEECVFEKLSEGFLLPTSLFQLRMPANPFFRQLQ